MVINVPPLGLLLALGRALQLGAITPTGAAAAATALRSAAAAATAVGHTKLPGDRATHQSSSALIISPRSGRCFSTKRRTDASQLGVPPLPANPHGPPAFVFDIDGVLIRGRNVLPEAKQAAKKVRL